MFLFIPLIFFVLLLNDVYRCKKVVENWIKGANNSKIVPVLHLDLGLGGAERLIVDACLSLKSEGYIPLIFTGYYNKNRCFQETLSEVCVVTGGCFIPKAFFGKMHVICSAAKLMWLVLICKLIITNPSWVILDQLPTPLPLMRMLFRNAHLMYYCHYPDALLKLNPRYTFLVAMYDSIFSSFEWKSMSFADSLAYNSTFTQCIVHSTFPKLKSKLVNTREMVIYPSVYIQSQIRSEKLPSERVQDLKSGYILCLNRFDPCKNTQLAIEAYKLLPMKQNKLVIAGGYDDRLQTNVYYLKYLKSLITKYDLESLVDFMPSISDTEKDILVRNASMLIYTPIAEHFGIVPLEAMIRGTLVIAVNNGGPKETIQEDMKYGRLLRPDAHEFAAAMNDVLTHPLKYTKILEKAQKYALQNYSLPNLAHSLVTLRGSE